MHIVCFCDPAKIPLATSIWSQVQVLKIGT